MSLYNTPIIVELVQEVSSITKMVQESLIQSYLDHF